MISPQNYWRNCHLYPSKRLRILHALSVRKMSLTGGIGRQKLTSDLPFASVASEGGPIGRTHGETLSRLAMGHSGIVGK